MKTLSQIQIRDPFILPRVQEGLYYLFGTTDSDPSGDTPGAGFNCYTSRDLKAWEGPFPVSRPQGELAKATCFWAPEVHEHDGAFYMFASIGDWNARGTYVLRAEHPRGPFELWSEGPVTPPGDMAIDGTPYWDEDGQPWLVYCHEWVQLTDGTMCARRLSYDLKRGEGQAHVLFAASQAPWSGAVAQGDKPKSYVTDAPYFHRLRSGELLMLWSSRGDFGYDVGIARSANGSVLGPWTHDAEPIFGDNGGHPMLFETFEGQLMMALHTEKGGNKKEYALLLPLEEQGERLVVGPVSP